MAGQPNPPQRTPFRNDGLIMPYYIRGWHNPERQLRWYFYPPIYSKYSQGSTGYWEQLPLTQQNLQSGQ